MLDRIRLVLRTVFLRRRLEREMQEEMSDHLVRASERLMARGLTESEAMKAARREFGNLDVIQEDARDARGARWIESIVADLRFGIRHFARTPISTLTMVVLLALGIGINSALFTLIYSMVNMPPPGITRSESLVRIRGIDRSRGAGDASGREFSYPEYREYAAQRNLFSSVAAWTSSDVVLDVGVEREDLHSAAATYVTTDYFHVLGVQPILGAGLPASSSRDDGAPDLVGVISYTVWDRHFARARDVIGRTVKLNDVLVTVVGVAPPRFAGARTGGSQLRVWLPLNARPLIQRTSVSALSSYDSMAFGVVARLQPHIVADQTLPTVQAIAARSAQQLTRSRADHALSSDVVVLLGGNYFPPSGEAPSVFSRVSTLFIPLLILLIPCTNVSALLVGLAVARRREIAVRLSLGAARRRIIRQLITESVLLALAAALLGLCVIAVLLNQFGARIPDLQLVVNWPAIVFTFGLAIATGILFGASPALHASRLAVADVLKGSAAGVVASRSRLQSGLVVTQIALTQPLLLSLGALILSLLADLNQLPALRSTDRIMQVSFNTNPRYGTLDQEREDVLRRLEARIAAFPGVEGTVRQQPMDDYVEVAVHPTDRLGGLEHSDRFWLRAQGAPPGFFEVMGLSFVRGHGFNQPHAEDQRAIVIRSDLARRLWGSTDPIGRRLVHATGGANGATAFVVVGVVDANQAGPGDEQEPRVFVPTLNLTGSILVRTRGPAQPMIPLIRTLAQNEAPTQPVTRITTLEAIENQQRALIAKLTSSVATGGVVALLLCAIGLYAVVAFAVGQRTREIGIRTAMGADPQRVARMFFIRGLRLSFFGLLIGLTLSLIAVRIIAVVQGEDSGAGLSVLAAIIALIVVGVASLATWIPARRAAGVDPLLALRAE